MIFRGAYLSREEVEERIKGDFMRFIRFLNILLARSCSPEDLFAAQARLLRVRNASIDAVAELSNRTRQLPSAPGVCLISANLNFWDGCLPQRGGRTQPGVLTPGKRTPQRSAL
jgi:hypothetical protein